MRETSFPPPYPSSSIVALTWWVTRGTHSNSTLLVGENKVHVLSHQESKNLKNISINLYIFKGIIHT